MCTFIFKFAKNVISAAGVVSILKTKFGFCDVITEIWAILDNLSPIPLNMKVVENGQLHLFCEE